MYTNNRTVSYVSGGVLTIAPQCTTALVGAGGLNGDMDIWGGTPADVCTSNAFYGCERGGPGNIVK